MSIGYRAVMRLESNKDAVNSAEVQLRAWLGEKRRDRRSSINVEGWEGPGLHLLGGGAELRVVHDDYDPEHGRRRLYRLTERNTAGTFVVSLYAAALPGLGENGQTIVVEVDQPDLDQETALNTIDPPRVARALLDAEVVRDSQTRLTGRPIAIHAGDTIQVVRAITDPGRSVSVVVAGSPARDLDDDWAKAVASLTRQSVGVSATFVIYADAMAELERTLGNSHRVGAGRVRTYLPKVDLSDPADSLRHKWLGPATFTRSLDGKFVASPLARRHAEVARRRFVELELPADIRRTIGVLRRAETTAEREQKVAERLATVQAHETDRPEAPEAQRSQIGPEPDGSAPWYRRAAQSLRRWLAIDEATPDHFDQLDAYISAKVADSEVAVEQLDAAAAREDALDERLRLLQSRLEDMELDLAQAEQDDIEKQRELTELRRRLSRTVSPDTYVEPDSGEWAPPDSVEELADRITPGPESHDALKFVEFTGAIESAVEIDKRYPSGRYARTLWLYVRVLHDYAVAKARGDFNGGVHMYLTDDEIDGTKCPAARHAPRESDTVLQNAAWKAERVFPVPTVVDPSGSVLMDAHFKPTYRDTFAPRMHYYDDTAPGGTGKVYIGYIGRHLTNTRT